MAAAALVRRQLPGWPLVNRGHHHQHLFFFFFFLPLSSLWGVCVGDLIFLGQRFVSCVCDDGCEFYIFFFRWPLVDKYLRCVRSTAVLFFIFLVEEGEDSQPTWSNWKLHRWNRMSRCFLVSTFDETGSLLFPLFSAGYSILRPFNLKNS